MDPPFDPSQSSELEDEPQRGEASEAGETPDPDWAEIVRKIQAGDPAGMEELYSVFSRGIRLQLCRQLGLQELDDKVHDTFLIVVQSIQRGELREPSRLMGFVRTIVRRQVAAYISGIVHSRRDQVDLEPGHWLADDRGNPEQVAIDEQQMAIMRQVLGGISNRDREILTRFYLDGQTAEEICRDMDLTETQFRLLKSRAKARFAQLGRRKVERKEGGENNMRKSAGA